MIDSRYAILPAGGHKKNSGLTIIEMVVTIVILAIAMTALSTLLSTGSNRGADTLLELRAVALGQSYMDEIMGRRFDENSNPRGVPPCRPASPCTAEGSFGPDTGETERIEYDDVDDYDGLDEGDGSVGDAPLLDAEGNERVGYGNFRVQVSVRYLNIGAGGEEENLGVNANDLNNETDAKLVTVTVSYRTRPEGIKFSAYKANF